MIHIGAILIGIVLIAFVICLLIGAVIYAYIAFHALHPAHRHNRHRSPIQWGELGNRVIDGLVASLLLAGAIGTLVITHMLGMRFLHILFH